MKFFKWMFRSLNRDRELPPPIIQAKSFSYYCPPWGARPCGPGIQVETIPNSDFYYDTIDTLDAIYATPTGEIVIEELINSGRKIKITKATLGNSCDVGPTGMNAVAQEVREEKIGPETKKALERTKLFDTSNIQGSIYAFLARKINLTPFYKMSGIPINVSNSIGINEQHVKSFFDSGRITDQWSKDDKQHIMNSIIVNLEKESAKGIGSDAAIGFNGDPTFIMNTERPPGIGLAHELIHAYWSVRGEQPGWTVFHPTTVLFEFKCVGLGPWKHQANVNSVCENQIRQEWYANTATLFEQGDFVNRSQQNQRLYYSKPSAT